MPDINNTPPEDLSSFTDEELAHMKKEWNTLVDMHERRRIRCFNVMLQIHREEEDRRDDE